MHHNTPESLQVVALVAVYPKKEKAKPKHGRAAAAYRLLSITIALHLEK